jgi:predicted dehydrogenase
MTPIKLAIVGCGAITDQGHLPAALRSSRVEVAALLDSSPERARRLCRKYACTAEVETDLERVLSRVDGVLIATPNHTHGPLARVVLERGLPVLIEKPLTTSVAEAEELCRLAKRHGTLISVGFVTRHYPATRLMKRVLDEARFGHPVRFHAEFGTAGGWTPLSNYTLDRKQAGGGVLIVNGTHAIDRLLYWFGEPLTVAYADDSYGGVEANCKAQLEYASGLRGSLFFSKTIALRNKFVVHTDDFRIELPAGETRRLTVIPKDAPILRYHVDEAAAPDTKDFFLAQIDEFATVIRDGGIPTVDGEAATASVRLCEALYAKRTQLDEPWAWYRRWASEPAR